MIVEVLMPQWGMGMDEGVIALWCKSVGDAVQEGEVIATVEAEKIEGDLEAPASGTLTEIVVAQGDTAVVRQVVALIDNST